ncbi:hypothetical protein [endosymbiont 'TC1' of Trimyema compressum]|uniref:hypothetical protein n=1 Tax=endosymbiont 'TC1' of Trimyema compressum TaxID=243899 RepID=UPI00139248D1|nr:hypothetical protein [endosymbiont 'TC1' of Trimyema compressum]
MSTYLKHVSLFPVYFFSICPKGIIAETLGATIDELLNGKEDNEDEEAKDSPDNKKEKRPYFGLIPGVVNKDIHGDVGKIRGVVNGDIYGDVKGSIMGEVNNVYGHQCIWQCMGNGNGDITGYIGGNLWGIVTGSVKEGVHGRFGGKFLELVLMKIRKRRARYKSVEYRLL